MELTRQEILLLQKVLADLHVQVCEDGFGRGYYNTDVRLTVGDQMDFKELGGKLGL